MMGDDDSQSLGDLPPSAKLVYKVLEKEGPLTQKRITEESMLSSRTVRYALNQLEEINAVTEQVHLPDARQNIYELADSESD